jgi:allophanate hydrolase
MAEPLTLADYRAAYAAGTLTPRAAIEAVYRRIEAHGDPAIFIALRPVADLLAEAEALEAKGSGGALWGIPVAVKDNIDVAGIETTAACPAFAYTPEVDAIAVARLKAAGALIVGKTNLDQFATGLVGVRSPYGVPRNTARADLVPGGSSSGSGVAVAAGLVPISLGTDTAGSGRVPAGLNNIVGLKPTLGAVPTQGVVPACRSLDCVSVFALTVDDAFEAASAMAGFAPSDPFSRRIGLGTRGPVPAGLRIGIPVATGLVFGGDPLAEAAFAATLADLETLVPGRKAVDMTPLFETAKLLYHGPWVGERWAATRTTIETQPEAMLDVTRAIVGQAKVFSAADAFDGQYRLAELRREAEAIFAEIDVLVVPTFPRPRTLADLAADPVGPNSEFGTYTNFVNLLDLCALAVPGRFRSDDLPAGVTLIAPAGRDGLLASLGAALHVAAGVPMGATGAPLPAPSVPVPALAEEEIEIVVVGAHLSGLQLNHELTGKGGRFLRAVLTAPDYRFFALPGGPPIRPGLLRVPAGKGASIETEVWALPAAGFGTFVAGIPAPLGIGTVRLADGTAPKGFLVEPEGVRDAKDISRLGGWRAFLASRDAA